MYVTARPINILRRRGVWESNTQTGVDGLSRRQKHDGTAQLLGRLLGERPEDRLGSKQPFERTREGTVPRPRAAAHALGGAGRSLTATA